MVAYQGFPSRVKNSNVKAIAAIQTLPKQELLFNPAPSMCASIAATKTEKPKIANGLVDIITPHSERVGLQAAGK
jgi:hypothetical protein